MKLFTKEILDKLPKLGATNELDAQDVKVPLKLFNPCGSQSWFITEYDPDEKLAFGYVTGMYEDELGYISIRELEELTLPFGLSIERDIHWNMNNTLKEVMEKSKS